MDRVAPCLPFFSSLTARDRFSSVAIPCRAALVAPKPGDPIPPKILGH